MQTNFVLVHLGKNPSPTLMSTAQAESARLKNPRLILITDFPELWKDFPGEVIEYKHIHRNEFISKFVKKYPELSQIAGGYWLYTLERLFALRVAYDALTSKTPFVHLESDVMSLLNQDDFDLLVRKCKRIACPRSSKYRGIASIFFVPNKIELERVLLEFTQILNQPKAPINDMDLLGICLNSGILDELPSNPSQSWENDEGEKLVFDGAAYGQYLFGQDPFHTNGKRISGFQNPHFSLELKQTEWFIEEGRERLASDIFFLHKGTRYRVMNLHIHSKLVLNAPSMDDLLWRKSIFEANGEIARIADSALPNSIHNSRISIQNRIRLARRNGLLLSLQNTLIRRNKVLVQKLKSNSLRFWILKLVKDTTRPARLYFKFHNKWTRKFFGSYFGLSALDQDLESYLPMRHGYFVELGANDGISQSNTKYFELFKGWQGVLVEPYKPNFDKCRKNRKNSTKTFHAACVPFSYKMETIQLIYSNLMTITSGNENEIPDQLEHALEGKKFLELEDSVHTFFAPARTLDSILEEAGAPQVIDLLSLDVEGYELEVLRGVNHKKFRFRYICVESRNRLLMKDFMSTHHYSYVTTFKNGDLLFKDENTKH